MRPWRFSLLRIHCKPTNQLYIWLRRAPWLGSWRGEMSITGIHWQPSEAERERETDPNPQMRIYGFDSTFSFLSEETKILLSVALKKFFTPSFLLSKSRRGQRKRERETNERKSDKFGMTIGRRNLIRLSLSISIRVLIKEREKGVKYSSK